MTVTAEELLSDLGAALTGVDAPDAVARQLRVPLSTPFVLAALAPSCADGSETARRLDLRAQTFLEAFRSRAATAALGDVVYVCLPLAGRGGRDGALRLLHALHGDLSTSLPHRAAVSCTTDGLQHLVRARDAVDGLLALAARRGWTGLTDGDRAEAALRLQEIGELALARPHLLQGRVMRVVDYDAEKGGHLVGTLREWFACGGDSVIAADRLGLHENTVRYRLRRIQQIADISLEDPDERLLAELQVRMLVA